MKASNSPSVNLSVLFALTNSVVIGFLRSPPINSYTHLGFPLAGRIQISVPNLEIRPDE